jgi:Protein of unknown function (DUF3617)
MKSLALALLGATAAWAADPTPMDIKTGEWEYTVTVQMTGLPQQSAKQMPSIPPEQLAKLPPDQRAKVEAMLKQAGDMSSGKPTTTTNKNCVKKEDLAKLNPSGNTDQSCKMTVLSSSRSKQEIKMDCDSSGNKTTSTMTIESSGSESTKFSLVSSGTQNGRPMNMTVNGTGKWLSATCTESK